MQADYLSKIIDVGDWVVSYEIFNFLNEFWGPHTFDRFANCDNSKLGKFSSLYWNPGTLAVNAFTCNWANENNWLVPPVSLAARAINHIVRCKAKGTLIVPKWPFAVFWPLIFKAEGVYHYYVKDVLEFFETDRIFMSGNNANSIFANGKFVGSVLAVRIEVNE